MARGIVLRCNDEVIEGRAKAAGLKVVVSDSFEIPFEKTLFVEAGTRVPWDLLPAAWDFLDRWDAAVPLWRYGVLAADVGTAEERKLTAGIVGDLRVLLHAVELVFVRNNMVGKMLMATWGAECGADGSPSTESPSTSSGDGDRRMAFLRALYQVKPRLCVLPTSWLAEVRDYGRQVMGGRRVRQRPINAGKPLVTVELEPGRFVKCHAGDEERVRANFERQRKGR